MPSKVTPEQVLKALEKSSGNHQDAATALGVSLRTVGVIVRKLKSQGKKVPVSAKAPTVARSVTELSAEIRELRGDVRRLSKSAEFGDKMLDFLNALGVEARAAKKPPAWTLNPLGKPSDPGVPTLFLSDLHWGEKVVPSQIGGVNKYNLEIAHQRLDYTIETAIHLCRILDRDMTYPGICVPLGGDMVSGHIHEELEKTNDLDTIPTVLDLRQRLRGGITRLLKDFPAIFLPCVTGNHGRNTKKIQHKSRHHTSFDWMLYKLLEDDFRDDPRVTFFIPDGPDALYRIFNTRYLLTHGDQFRAGDSIIGPIGPLMRGNQKKTARNQAVRMDYDVMIAGHWHTYMHLRRLIVNGSMKGLDEYAYDGNFGFEEPMQALWVTHPRYGMTYRMPVLCEQQPKTVPEAGWISVAQQ